MIVDCQPGGCGRNATVLRELSESSGVNIIACTGYHLDKYYPNDYWLFQSSTESVNQYFTSEIQTGIQETLSTAKKVRAGFIKIACHRSLEKSPIHLMKAAVMTSLQTGVAVEAHTEKGADVEQIVKALFEFGLPPDRLILCHMDKRPDFNLHRSLAQEGITLEYDTFYRPKYQPDENVWPLLGCMVDAGFTSSVVLATDMAEAKMWRRIGGEPGLTGLMKIIIPRLKSMGFDSGSINKLLSGNIAACLAYPCL
jgi:phosphotriesterase-related protein